MPRPQTSSRRQCSPVISRRGSLRRKKVRERHSRWNESERRNIINRVFQEQETRGLDCILKVGVHHVTAIAHQTRSKFGLSNGILPTFAILIHRSCTFTRTTSP